MQKALQSMVLNLIVLAVFVTLIALAVVAIQSAAADEGDAQLTSQAVLDAPAAHASPAGVLRP